LAEQPCHFGILRCVLAAGDGWVTGGFTAAGSSVGSPYRHNEGSREDDDEDPLCSAAPVWRRIPLLLDGTGFPLVDGHGAVASLSVPAACAFA